MLVSSACQCKKKIKTSLGLQLHFILLKTSLPNVFWEKVVFQDEISKEKRVLVSAVGNAWYPLKSHICLTLIWVGDVFTPTSPVGFPLIIQKSCKL